MKTLLFEGYRLLSDAEKNAFALLEKNDHDSMWGIAIRNVCAAPNSWKFRTLVCQLKSQAADNGATMKRILGEAYDAVMEL